MGASTIIYSELSRDASIRRIEGLHDTITAILEGAASHGRPSADIADEMAVERIRNVAAK